MPSRATVFKTAALPLCDFSATRRIENIAQNLKINNFQDKKMLPGFRIRTRKLKIEKSGFIRLSIVCLLKAD